MLIDSWIEEKNEMMLGFNLSGATVFRIEESFGAFWDEVAHQPVTSESGINISSYLPYDNMALHFHDAVLWLTMKRIEGSPDEWFICGRLKTNLFAGTYISEIQELIISWTMTNDFGLKYIQINGPASPSGVDVLSAETPQNIQDLCVQLLEIVQRFMHLLSCRNVKSVDQHPSQKIQKARAKKEKLPLLSWKTLLIESKTSSGSQVPGEAPWSNRIHLCRGHMAEYGTNGKGLLFGKISGRFWIPPHVKGNKKLGVVMKDYKIKGEE